MAEKVIYLDQDEYEWYGEENGWDTDVIYREEMYSSGTSYFYSPDGVGRVWFDTLQEMYDEVYGSTKTPIVVVRRKG